MSNEAFSNEQVWSLADYIHKNCSCNFKGDIHFLICEWLKQNKPCQVVVGLTDEQISTLTEVVAGIDNIARIENRITGYLMTQKFTTSSVNEVVVGLTDSQIKGLSFSLLNFNMNLNKSIPDTIREYLDTQVFTKPKEVLVPQPDWDQSPDWANWLGQDKYGVWYWHEAEPEASSIHFNSTGKSIKAEFVNPDWADTLQQRPVSKQHIKVGSEWKFNNFAHNVVAITKINDIEYIVVDSIYDDNPYPAFTKEEFLSKFEKIL